MASKGHAVAVFSLLSKLFREICSGASPLDVRTDVKKRTLSDPLLMQTLLDELDIVDLDKTIGVERVKAQLS